MLMPHQQEMEEHAGATPGTRRLTVPDNRVSRIRRGEKSGFSGDLP